MTSGFRSNPCSFHGVISSGIPATSTTAPAPAAAIPRARWSAAFPATPRRAATSSSRSRGIDVVGEPRGHLRRDIEPQLHSLGRGPGRVGVGKSVRPGRRPQRLAQQIEAAEIAAGIFREFAPSSRPVATRNS